MQCASGAGGNGLIDLSAVGRDDQDLAGHDVALVGRADQIHRAGLGADDVRVAEAAERQRPEAVRIANRNQPVLRQHDQRKRALHLRDRLDDRVFDAARFRSRVEVQNHFGVAVRLEDRSLLNQLVAQLARVHDVAVVAERDLAVRAVDQDRLRVEQLALARRRIAHVSDRQRSGQAGQRFAVEDVGDVAHLAGDAHLRAVGRGNAGAFLPAMLQRIQAEIRHVGRFGVTEDAEDAALVFEFIEHGVQATR